MIDRYRYPVPCATGELLTLAAMVLGIFINVGQISKNAVGRNIYYTSLDTTGFDATLRTLANQNNVNVGTDVYASDQAAVEGDNRGLKNTVSRRNKSGRLAASVWSEKELRKGAGNGSGQK